MYVALKLGVKSFIGKVIWGRLMKHFDNIISDVICYYLKEDNKILYRNKISCSSWQVVNKGSEYANILLFCIQYQFLWEFLICILIYI